MYNFGRHYAFSFSSTCTEMEPNIENLSNFGSFEHTPWAPWVQKSWKLKFKFPFSKYVTQQAGKDLVMKFSRRRLQYLIAEVHNPSTCTFSIIPCVTIDNSVH